MAKNWVGKNSTTPVSGRASKNLTALKPQHRSGKYAANIRSQVVHSCLSKFCVGGKVSSSTVDLSYGVEAAWHCRSMPFWCSEQAQLGAQKADR
ncbi:MAG: hypothetical protein ACTS6O_09525, partial [Giesbergeria sp.]